MTFPRNSLRAFLQFAKNNLAQARRGQTKVNIVIGNESADLDSLTSSLLYAYIRSSAPPSNAFSPKYVPLLNITTSGLRLRPEFSAVCDHVDVSLSSLITLDDFPTQTNSLEDIRVILVDHNKLQGEIGKNYASSVDGVIDHHEDENAVPLETDPEPRIIEKCGSCTSLVVRYLTPIWDNISNSALSSGAAHGKDEVAISDSSVTQGWDAQVAKMALASILVDTANLTAPGKVEKVDREAVEYLESKIQMSPKHAKSWNRNRYYEELEGAKRDLDSLTVDEILVKDYKQWTENGIHLRISSVMKPLKYLVQNANTGNDNFDKVLSNFMTTRNLSIYAIMTVSTSSDSEFQRQLLVQAREDGFQAVTRFVTQATSTLELEEIEVEGVHVQSDPTSYQEWRRVWLQKDISKSRKQVAPLLRECMRAIAS
ncbi:Exopolyphosphatase [Lecanora helva]